MIVTASCSSSALQVQDHCSISKNGSLCFKVSILTFPACYGNQEQSTILNFTYVCLHPHTHTAHTLTHTHCSHPHTLLTPSPHCSHPHHAAHTLTHIFLIPSHTPLIPSHTLFTHSLLTPLHTHHSHPHTYCSHPPTHRSQPYTHTAHTIILSLRCSHSYHAAVARSSRRQNCRITRWGRPRCS